MSRTFRWRLLAGLLCLVLLAGACGDDDSDETTSGGGDAPAEDSTTLRLGYFPNVTHAAAIVGVENGILEERLAESDATLETLTFDTGTEAIEAMFAGEIDASYIGPNPAINGFAQSGGSELRIVSGATSGGAALVVNSDIAGPEDLEGATLASPSLGNTQDVALRAWLADQGYETDTEGGGDVSIIPQENSQTLETFLTGDIDGAWVPEPWATRLQVEADAHVLVNEADLWPEGEFVTTHLIVQTDFLEESPDVVKSLIEGHIEATDFVNSSADEAKQVVNGGIERITTSALADEVIDGAWENLTFTLDPIASSLQKSAEDAETVGLLDPVELDGIYDLSILNGLLGEAGQPAVAEL